MNIAELAVRGLSTGEHVSIIFEGSEYTNVQMDKAACRLGNALKKLGVGPQDRVILQMPNAPEVLQSFQAVWKIGAVCVPVNFQVGAEEIAYIYQDSGAATVITAPEFLDKVRIARAGAPGVKNVIVVSAEPVAGAHHFAGLLAGNSDQLDIYPAADDDVAALVYTSGTTGRPKGVMQTHYALYYTAVNLQATTEYPPDTVTVAMLPLCHSYGIGLMNTALLRTLGKTVVLRQFNLEQLFSAIEKYRVNSVAAVPTMYIYMLNYPDYKKYDLRSVKYYICGSAPLSGETWKQFKEKFGGEIAEGWGLTEACANNALNPVLGLKKVGSIGKPMKNMEMKIVNDRDEELPPGREGEIVLRGPMVMKGYWKQPEATAEMIRNGWLHTGDIGYVDEDGYFFITDRKKDIIIKGGENISPRAVEEVLYTHPAVSEAAVIGVKDKVYGEDLKAFVVLKPGETAEAEDILAFCKGRLKRFFVPKEVVVIQAMPKSLVGKILKKELRKL
ncbi:MAG: long-chain-fatty-acid--CoA ligase [Deltaproteobacteria bacterium]|jgi:long-chain acyl-CoA synthetase|nr:long-chain-fatty-acid--CoA ligase [Syntrophaceae bacterium]